MERESYRIWNKRNQDEVILPNCNWDQLAQHIVTENYGFLRMLVALCKAQKNYLKDMGVHSCPTPIIDVVSNMILEDKYQ
jgi:hypothetical protein